MATEAMPSVPGASPTRSMAPVSAAIGTLVPSADEKDEPPNEKWRVPSGAAGPISQR